MYQGLAFIHILSGVVWVDGPFVLHAVERRTLRSGGQEGAARTMRELECADDWIFSPAPLLVLLTGITGV